MHASHMTQQDRVMSKDVDQIRIVNPFSTLHVNKLNVGNTIEANVIFWSTSLDITRSC
jgi:hypothetical protein